MKTFGATLTLMPTKDMSFYLGYIGGPESPRFPPTRWVTAKIPTPTPSGGT